MRECPEGAQCMHPKRIVLLLGLAALVLAVGAVVALAQPAQPGPGGDPFGQPPMQPGGNGPQPGRLGGGGGGFPGMAMMGAMAQPVMAISDGFVFVVQGGTLYKFDQNTLEQVGKVTFLEPPPMMMPMGGDAVRGDRGGRGGGGGQPPIQ